MTPPRRRILITNIGLTSRTGTEIVTRDLAFAFLDAGHSPMVYTPAPGVVGEQIRARGIPVVEDLARLAWAPEVIHGHHHQETIQAVQFFPRVPALFVCHDRHAWHDEPPLHPCIRRWVAVDANCLERLREHSWIEERRALVVHNAVDLDRFRPRPPLDERPRRALIFSNYAAAGGYVEAVREACRRRELSLDVIGSGVGNACAEPESVLGAYDLVFGKARCALEAMAAGLAVVLCDVAGLGPMVTSGELERLHEWNFGARLLTQRLDPANIVRQIDRYDPRDAACVTAWIRAHAGVREAAARYLALYAEMLQEPAPGHEPASRYPATRRLGRIHQALLGVRHSGCPDRVAPGEALTVPVEVSNFTGIPVATSPPCPALLLARWVSNIDGRRVIADAARGILQPPVAPWRGGCYKLRVVAPREAGDYRLRVTLMQEGWRYLDQFTPRVYADARVLVGDSPESTRP